MERRTFLKLAALVPGLALAGCGGSKTLLSPKDPTMLSIWHVYGEQADSPMNRLLTEFNDTVGREKGILLNVTNMTNSAAKMCIRDSCMACRCICACTSSGSSPMRCSISAVVIRLPVAKSKHHPL